MKKSLFSAIFLTLLASASVATAQIQMTFTIVQPTCHGFTNGSATVYAVGGTGGYTYLWSTNQTTQTTFGIGSGTYTVTVTDGVQNTASGQISVAEPSAVIASITTSNLNCAGNNGSLTANGFGGTPGTPPYTYAWDGPAGPSLFKTAPVVGPGNYYLTVTDANNCSGVTSYTVAPELTVDVVATDIPCSTFPQGGSANATVSGGIPPYAYSWSNGGHNSLITNISQGEYFCTVTSANGCTAVGSDRVDMPPPLEVIITWLSPSCGFNNNGSITVQASGGTPPYVYTWPSPLPTGPSQTGLAPGLYYVCTFDSNLCQKDLWVNIPHITGLDVQLVVTSATCIGINNATATAVASPPGSNYIYQWNILPADSNVVQVTGLSAGTIITVTVTDPVSGCTGTATGTVGGHTNIDIAVTDVDILCAGGFGSATAVASNGTPPYTYSWYSDTIKIGNSSSIDSLNAGAYWVSVVDSQGCEAQAVVDIGIQSAPNAVIDGGHVLVCGDSLSVVQFINQSTDPYNVITTLVWTVTGPNIDTVINNQNQITFQLPVDDTIKVQLIATSGLGCSDTATLVYNVPGFPDISLSIDSTTINCTGDSISIHVLNGDSSYTYVWTPAVTFNPNPLHVLVYPTVTTTYVLTVTDGNACTTKDSLTIEPAGGLFQLIVAETLIQTCEDSVELFASTIPPGIATIVWSQGGVTLIGNPVTVPATPNTTIYTVTAIASDSCFLKQDVSVTGYDIEISIDPNAETSICEGDSLPLSVIVTPFSDSLTYVWSVNAPALILNPTSANPILTGPVGTYTVTVIVTNVVCSDTLSFPIEILPGFNLDGQISADLCEGLEVSFFNTSGVTGTWDFGDGTAPSIVVNPVHLYSAAGQYHVIFTPNISFQCTAAWDSTITVHAEPLEASIAANYIDCAEEAEIQFLGSSNYPNSDIVSWAWTFSEGAPASAAVQNPIVTFTQEGTITATLVVRDINGCLDTVSLPLEVHLIIDSIPDSAMICPGDSVQLNPNGFDLGATYLWTSMPFDPTLVANDPTPMVSPTVPTLYTVVVSQGLCSATYNVLVTFKPGGQVILSDDMVVCSDSLITLTAQSNGATGFEWSISPSFNPIFATTQTVQVQPPGTFYVRTTGAVCSAVDSIHIILSIPVIQITQVSDIICEGGFGSATAVASNGTPQYTYAWFDITGQIGNSASITGLAAGTYTVSVTDAVGCTAQTTVEIKILSSPNAVIDSAQVLVCGDSLTTVQFTSLSTDPYNSIDSIVWIVTGQGVISQTNPVTFQLPVGQTVIVQLIAISSLGCADTTSLTYKVPGIPDISISLDSTTLNCNGDPVALNVTGDSTLTYVWNPAVTLNPDPLHVLVNPTVVTTYLLTATDGGVCTATDSIRIAPVDGSFQLIVSDSLIQTCEDSVILSATTIPLGIATIVWSQGGIPLIGNPVTVPATSTTTIYTVIAISADSCFRTDQVVVTGFGIEASLDPNAETSVCEGDSLQLSVIVTPPSVNVTYQWTVNAPATILNPTAANPILTGPVGSYMVTVIVTNVICSDTVSFPVQILESMDLNGLITADLCNGLEVQFSNPSGMSGTWDFGDGSPTSTNTNPLHIYASAGLYPVVFSPIGLQCVAPWDSIILVHALPLEAGIAANYLNCADEAEIQFNGSSNFPDADIAAWAWTFSDGTPAIASQKNPIVTFIQEGTVLATLVVEDINGCLDTATLPLEVHLINDSIPDAALICPGDSVQLNPDGFDPNATYLWTSIPVDPTLVANDPTPVVYPTVPTTYSVVISQGLCSVSYTVQVNFKPGGVVNLPDDFVVCNSDSISITAQSNGATGFEWSTTSSFVPVFATTQTVKVLAPGTYYVRTTGAVCVAIDSVHIGLGTLDLQISPVVDIVCEGGIGSATASASNGLPPYTYTWYNSAGDSIANTATISVLLPGTYTVSVADAQGCTAQAQAEIRLLSAPNALIDSIQVLVCGDSLSTVQFVSLSSDTLNNIDSIIWTVTGPGVNFVVAQQDTISLQLPVGDTVTVQLVAISDLGCRDTATLVFKVPGIPDFTLSIDSSTINCNIDSVSINVIGGDPSYSYVWVPAVTFNPDPQHVLVSPSVATTYVLTVTDGNACSATDSIAVAPIIFQLFVSETLVETCADSVTIYASTNIPATIYWVLEGDIVFTGDTLTVPATFPTKIYTVTAFTSDSCRLEKEVSITGYGIIVSLDSNAVHSICEGDSLPLSVIVTPPSDSLTYQWSVNAPATIVNPGTANPILTGPAGNYTVTVIVTNVVCSDTLSFQVEILDSMDLDGLIFADLCNGLEVQFSNPNNIAGTWDFGDGSPTSSDPNPVHIYASAGQYPVVFSPIGLACVAPWDSTITVFEFPLEAEIAANYLNCGNQAEIQFNGSSNYPDTDIASWAWTFSNGTPANASQKNPIVIFNQEGTVVATLIAEDINGCLDTATMPVEILLINDSIPDAAPICLGDSVQLNPNGIDVDATYLWTSVPADPTLVANDPTPVVYPTVPTIYTVVITQGLCSVTYTVLVDFKPGGVVTLPDNFVVCNSDSISITAQSNGANGYEWSTSSSFVPVFATTQTVKVLAPGTFYVRTTGSECVAVDSVQVGIGTFAVQITPIVDIVCEGDLGSATAVASSGVPPYTYTWYNSSGDSIANSASISVLLPGTYTVSVTDSLGCTTQAEAAISLLSAPIAWIDSIQVLVCGDSLSTIQFISLSTDTINTIDSIFWTVTGSGVNFVIAQQDTIALQLPVGDTITVQLVAISDLGCIDTTILTFKVPGIPDITINLDSTTLNCTGEPLKLCIVGGNAGYTYNWSPTVTLSTDSLCVLVSPTLPTTYVLTTTDGGFCSATDSITVAPFDGTFELVVSDSLIETCSDSVALFASTSIASTIVWYQGNTPLVGNPVTVPATSVTTIYTVQAVTADSCVQTDQVSVTGYGVEVSLDPNAETSICEGDSLPLSVIVTPLSSTLGYQWSVNPPAVLSDPSAANPILSGPAGIYTVSVTVTNSAAALICADSLSFPIEILPGFDLNPHISVDLCNGLTVSFDSDTISGTWSFGDGNTSTANNPTHTYASEGQYQVIFTPNNIACAVPWDSLITLDTVVLSAYIDHSYVNCTMVANIQYNGSTNYPGIFGWNWTFSKGAPATSTEKNPLISYTDEGVYFATLVVMDSLTRCTATATDSINVGIITDILDDSLQICLGDTLQLNPVGIDPDAKYSWTSVPLDPSLADPTNPNPKVSPAVSTIYTVGINQGDCTVSYSVVVTIKPESDVQIMADPASTICSAELWTLTAQSSNATKFEWSSSITFMPIFDTTQTVQVMPNGTYFVRTAGDVCSVIDSIVIDLKIPEIQVLPSDYNICLGEEAALMFTNLIPDQTLTCDWGPNLPMDCNLIVSPSDTTTYMVTVTNQYGCSDTLSFTVNVTSVTVDAVANPNLVTLQDPTTVLTATPGGNGTIISYAWTPEETLSSPNTAETEASPTETTIYTVTVTTDDGCVAIDTVTVFFRYNDCISPFVFIPKAFTPNNDQKNDYFIPMADGMTALKFIVWNRWGEIVYETNDPAALGWDGSYKGKEATPDSFAWYVWLTCGNGEIFEAKGNVTLLK